ncbi:UNVERIFIED_CONTAM: hypothetical protein Slati_2492000 [Sesamum latifolium]|uniref:Uncharacterized protein n=1 Tax=Sesamum latifolium TaxID=2727402 RepID=A0AAW2WFJ7_9LAMI
MAWRRTVYVSLGKKMKLGFIDGSISCPAFGSTDFEQRRRVDLMVTSWIWNTTSKDIVEAFVYCISSWELWLAIQTSYGRSNGPMVYQLQRDISTVSQDDLTLTVYLTKVTKLWNELSYLAPTPQCTCGGCTCSVNKAITNLIASTQLMQFLMVLHESYSSERSQILMQDPLPDIEKAFSMLAFKSNRREDEKLPQKKKTFVDKKSTFCTHCRKTGTGSTQNVANMMSELLKVLQSNTRPTDPISNFANFVHLDEEFAGPGY